MDDRCISRTANLRILKKFANLKKSHITSIVCIIAIFGHVFDVGRFRRELHGRAVRKFHCVTASLFVVESISGNIILHNFARNFDLLSAKKMVSRGTDVTRLLVLAKKAQFHTQRINNSGLV